MVTTSPVSAPPPAVSSPIGLFVRSRRKASRLTQRELGELAGVGTRFVCELERGKTTLRIDAVNRVLAVFGKTLGVVEMSDQGASMLSSRP